MTSGVFIVTFAPDAPFLALLMRSIERNLSGFSRIVVVCPQSDVGVIEPLVRRSRDGVVPEVVGIYEPKDMGHVWHTVAKLHADVFLPECQMIAHLDSDCVVAAPTTPDSYLDGDRINIVVCSYERAGQAKCWKPFVDRALGCDAQHETMQTPKLAYWRETYALTRRAMKHAHRMPPYIYAMTAGCLPEFDSLGHVAITGQPDRYRVIDVSEKDTWPDFVVQGWSRCRDNPEALAAELAKLEAAIQ